MLSNAGAALNNEIMIGYSPNDFFYSTGYEGVRPTNAQCIGILTETDWDIKCNDTNFTDNSNNCVLQQLCVNKKKVDNIKSIQNNQTGADERLNNTQSVYNYTLVNIVNLGVGIAVLVGLIYRYRKTST